MQVMNKEKTAVAGAENGLSPAALNAIKASGGEEDGLTNIQVLRQMFEAAANGSAAETGVERAWKFDV